jgi:hypothetical protein
MKEYCNTAVEKLVVLRSAELVGQLARLWVHTPAEARSIGPWIVIQRSTSAARCFDRTMQGSEQSAPFACMVLTREFEDTFGSSATTGGLLLRHRYGLPPQSPFIPIIAFKCPYQAKKKSMQSKKNKTPK